MNPVTDLYLGWETLTHAEPCPAPVWEPQLRIDQGRRGRLLSRDLEHTCQAEECEHGIFFTRFTVRLVCRACGAVHSVSGEDVGTSRTSTTAIGYGLPPQEHEGLWLWPGEQVLLDAGGGTRDWLITRVPVAPVRVQDIAGLICRHRTAGGHLRWQANAVPDHTGPYGDQQLRWARRESDHRTVEIAAEWVAAQYKPRNVEVIV
ncbi:hypothetical protein AB0912_15335 [Streptomyces sp. NPDC007084]|uniref:hypothetical protein n=1 Tax=Streptomyces sp. NPDC007084 TaxID=3154313 RepID=UPI003454B626